MLEGRKISEVNFNQTKTLSTTQRLDSNYFHSKELLEKLNKIGCFTLETACTWITQGPNPIFADYESIASLTGRNISKGFISPEGADQVSEAEYLNLRRFQINKNDIFITLKGAGSTGKLALLVAPFTGIFSRNIGLIRLNNHKTSLISPEFLYSYLSSKLGQKLIDRGVTGGTGQLTLPTAYLKTLPIPRLGKSLIQRITVLVQTSSSLLLNSQDLGTKVEQTLLSSLGLENWQPPTPLSYQDSAKSAFTAGRLDAEFFRPKIKELYKKLGSKKLTIRDIASLRTTRYKGSNDFFNYLEIGSVSKDGTIEESLIPGDEAPSRATWLVKKGDILTSTVRPVRGLTAMIEQQQSGSVASSGFAVLKPTKVSSELLMTYLKLPIICELMDLHTSASMYPAISVQDILALPFKHPGEATEKQIVDQITKSRAANKKSKALLERAKRAVEIAIETDESTALAYLNEK